MRDLSLEMNILKVASNAVREAQKKSLANGVANVYSKNGHIYFQLPDGTITEQMPKVYATETMDIQGSFLADEGINENIRIR